MVIVCEYRIDPHIQELLCFFNVIRPENVTDNIEAYKDSTFDTEVTGYELLGSEVLLYYKVGDASMTAKVDARTTARLGSKVTLAIEPENIHVFDKETEQIITN